jgi:hypothetical protein
MAWKLGISTKSGTEAAIDVCDYFTNEESSGSVSGKNCQNSYQSFVDNEILSKLLLSGLH